MKKTSSIKVSEFAFIGYPITDAKRARAFYEGVLNLKETVTWEHGGKSWTEYDLGGTTLAVANMWLEKWKPSEGGPALALEVEDFESTIARLRDAGAEFYFEPTD